MEKRYACIPRFPPFGAGASQYARKGGRGLEKSHSARIMVQGAPLPDLARAQGLPFAKARLQELHLERSLQARERKGIKISSFVYNRTEEVFYEQSDREGLRRAFAYLNGRRDRLQKGKSLRAHTHGRFACAGNGTDRRRARRAVFGVIHADRREKVNEAF